MALQPGSQRCRVTAGLHDPAPFLRAAGALPRLVSRVPERRKARGRGLLKTRLQTHEATAEARPFANRATGREVPWTQSVMT